MVLYYLILLMSIPCPKCGWPSRITVESGTPIQHCRCGLTKVLSFTSDGMISERTPLTKNNFSLPAKGTQLSKVLGCIAVLGKMTSSEVSERLKISRDKATTNLSVLRGRGLVKQLVDRRGKSGGSTWVLEPQVAKHFGSDSWH